MPIRSVNANNQSYIMSTFGALVVVPTTDTSDVTFPVGFNNDGNSTIRILFKAGVTVSSASTPFKINDVPVMVNKNGALTAFPITGTTYVSANTVIEFYYDPDYDGNGNPAWVVVGNPIVICTSSSRRFADGVSFGISGTSVVMDRVATSQPASVTTGSIWVS